MPYVQLPNGRDLEIPEGMDYESAMNAAKQQFPDAFGIQVKHGGWEAAKHGFKQSLEYGLRGIGSLTGTELTPTAEKIFAPDTSPEAYRPTTSENTALAFEKGVLPGIGSAISQHVTEPFAGAMSSYAIPMAGSAAATALGGPVAGGAAFTALAAPGEIQQNIEEQQRVRPGQAPDMTKAIMGGLVQAALLPVLGAAGGVVKNAVLKAIAPELATLTKAVASGAMAEEVAVASLQSTAKNLMIHTAEMGAVGVPLMAGTEAIRMGQAGEDLTSPEAVGRMGEATKAAIMGAPLFGVVGGMGVRGAQERQLKAAGEGYTGQWNEAHAINKSLVEQASLDRVQAAEQQAKDEQQAAIPQGAQMGLEIPGQPLSGQAETLSVRLARVQQELDQLITTRDAQVKSGMPPEDIKQTAAAIKQKKQELNYTKSALGKSRLAGEVEEAPTVAPTITRADFNEMGIPNDKAGKELRAYEGVAAGSPEMGELRDKLASLIDPEGENTPKWMTEEKAAKISEKLKSPLMLGEQQGLGLELPSNEAMQASMHEGRWQDRAQKMQTAAAAARAQKGADKTANTQGSAVQKVGQVQDMFNERNKAPYTTPAEAPVAPTPTDVQAKTAELSRQFNRAYKAHMQDPTDAVKRAELDRVLSIARQGTLFEEKPSEITEPGAPKPGADRTSAAVPAQASPRPEPGAGARPVKQGVARAVVPVEQPVVGEKPGVSALEKREAEAAATRDLKQENAEKLESKKRVADDRTKPAPVDKGWGAMEAPKLTPEEQAARDKATGPIGTNEAQTIGPTGIGGAAKASTVKEYTPAHTPLAEVSKGAGAKAAARLWWNDLDDMQTSKTDTAKKALAKGIAAGHITPEHLARAADIAAADRAQQVRLKNAQAARHEAKVAADKALNKQVAEITETAKTTHRQKVKAEAGKAVALLEEPKETGTESLNRISKEYAESTGEVDPDVAQVEHLLAALEPGMKVSLEVEGSNGEAKTIKHDAKKAIRAADRAAKNAESMLGCVLK